MEKEGRGEEGARRFTLEAEDDQVTSLEDLNVGAVGFSPAKPNLVNLELVGTFV